MLTFLEYVEKCNICPNELQPGDRVTNCNKECEHFGSTGVVKRIIKLLDPNSKNEIGNEVEYECDCDGRTWKNGQLLKKTEIQLKKI